MAGHSLNNVRLAWKLLQHPNIKFHNGSTDRHPFAIIELVKYVSRNFVNTMHDWNHTTRHREWKIGICAVVYPRVSGSSLEYAVTVIKLYFLLSSMPLFHGKSNGLHLYEYSPVQEFFICVLPVVIDTVVRGASAKWRAAEHGLSVGLLWRPDQFCASDLKPESRRPLICSSEL